MFHPPEKQERVEHAVCPSDAEFGVFSLSRSRKMWILCPASNVSSSALTIYLGKQKLLVGGERIRLLSQCLTYYHYPFKVKYLPVVTFV